MVRRYSRFIHRLVLKVGGRRAEAITDDVEQTVYLGIWKQLERGQEIRFPTSYVYTAAVRETLRLLSAPRLESWDDHDPEDEVATAGSGPSTVYERIRKADALGECLGLLAPERRAAVKAHLAGFAVDEIMKMHDWPYQKARNLIARGLADLRQHLRERGIDG